MKKIKVMSWTELENDVDHPGKLITVKYETPKILGLLINMIPASEIPRGREQFKLMSKIDQAFTKVEDRIDQIHREFKDKELQDNLDNVFLFLEENEYNFLKSIYEKYVPVMWGRSKNISKCFDYFDNAENFDPNTE